jgi:predicted RNase H-like HicB family nuclease
MVTANISSSVSAYPCSFLADESSLCFIQATLILRTRDSGGEPMTQGDRYVKLVEWSEEDQCFIGSCPELFLGGCHGTDARSVFDELCQIIDETIQLYEQDGKELPQPLSGREFVNAMQHAATGG